MQFNIFKRVAMLEAQNKKHAEAIAKIIKELEKKEKPPTVIGSGKCITAEEYIDYILKL